MISPLDFESQIDYIFDPEFLKELRGTDPELTAEVGYDEYIYTIDVLGGTEPALLEFVYNNKTYKWEICVSYQAHTLRRFLRTEELDKARQIVVGLLDTVGLKVEIPRHLLDNIKQ